MIKKSPKVVNKNEEINKDGDSIPQNEFLL